MLTSYLNRLSRKARSLATTNNGVQLLLLATLILMIHLIGRDPANRLALITAVYVLAAAGVILAGVGMAIRGQVRRRAFARARRAGRVEQNVTDLWLLVELCRALPQMLPPQALEDLATLRKRVWTPDHERAEDWAVSLATESLRLDTDTEDALAEIDGIVEGAAAVGVAMLVRDLLHPADQVRLIGWWATAGIPPKLAPLRQGRG